MSVRDRIAKFGGDKGTAGLGGRGSNPTPPALATQRPNQANKPYASHSDFNSKPLAKAQPASSSDAGSVAARRLDVPDAIKNSAADSVVRSSAAGKAWERGGGTQAATTGQDEPKSRWATVPESSVGARASSTSSTTGEQGRYVYVRRMGE